MRLLMRLTSASVFRTVQQGPSASVTARLGIALLLLLCCSSAYGQEIRTVTLADVSQEIGAEIVAPADVPVRYGMPELDKRLPGFVYPVKAQRFQIEGQVVVQFLLDKKGKVKDPQVVKGLGYGCDEEVLRVLRRGRFKPVLDEEGQPQPTQFVTVFDFQLDGGQ